MNEKIAEIQQLNKEKSKFMSPGFRKLIQLGAGRWAIFSQKINSLRNLTGRHLRWQFAIVFVPYALFFFQSSRCCLK